jgi:DNA-binding GntR family transcriptional regulator
MMVDAITDLLYSVRNESVKLADLDDEITQHAAILRALKERDADRAVDLMAIHLKTAATQMFAALETEHSARD